MKPESRAAQASGFVDPKTKALVPPVQLSTTFERAADGSYPAGYEYTRADNPGYEPVESLLAELEGGSSAMLFASGMAAATSVFCSLVPGDHVIARQVMYWALRRWLSEFALSWGITVTYVDPTDLAAGFRRDSSRDHPNRVGRDAGESDVGDHRHCRGRRRLLTMRTPAW